MKRVLLVKNLKKVYGKKESSVVAVDGISFHLKAGEIVGFLGPNGSGKTTTIQMLLGVLSASSGEIVYFDKEFPRYRSEILQYVSFASTYTSLPFLLTVFENLRCCGGYYGFSKKETEKRIFPLLERFGLLEKLDSPVASLSAGQTTRLMLVKAFLTEPKIVLLDEPTASLDPDIATEVGEFLLEQREKRGLSILFTSHKMKEVSRLCDRVIFLKKGKIIADDLPKKLAKSISSFKVTLTISDGLEGAIQIVEERALSHQIQHHSLKISLDEHQIPPFLKALMEANVCYTSIQIEEPSLEDYFLTLSKRPEIVSEF